MAEVEGASIVAMAAKDHRFLVAARVLGVTKLPRHVAILVDQLDSGRVEISYALVVFGLTAPTPYVMTAEVNEWASGTHDSHFLGRFDEGGHANLGAGPYGDVEAFVARALALASARFDDDGQPR